MPFVVEDDKATDPADIGLFGAQAVVAGPNGGAYPVEQLYRLWGVGCSDDSLAVGGSMSHKRQC